MEIPKTLNWVKARSECTLDQMYARLKEQVAGDVEEMKRTPRGARSAFALTVSGEHRFTASKQWSDGVFSGGDGVAFVLTRSTIEIKWARSEDLLFSVTPLFCADGACRFRANDSEAELEMWQVSQKALEALFFD